MTVSSVFTTLIIVVVMFFVSVAIVEDDPNERPFVNALLPELLPVLYGILSIMPLLWLITRDFSPFGDLGEQMLNRAGGHQFGDSWSGFFWSYFGGIIVSITNVLLMLLILAVALIYTSSGLWELVIRLHKVARLFWLAAKRIWWWVLDLSVHPPSLKTIREQLRSSAPSAERVRKMAEGLLKERMDVMKKGLPAEVIKSYARQHRKFADELSKRDLNARAEYNEALAKTARGLRESAMRRGGGASPSGEERDE